MDVNFNILSPEFVAESIKNLLIEGGLTPDIHLANTVKTMFLNKMPENASRREKDMIGNVFECLKKMNYKVNQELISILSAKLELGIGVNIQRIVKYGVKQQRSGEDIPVVIKGSRYEVYGIIDGHGASEYTHDMRFSEALYRVIFEHFQNIGNKRISKSDLALWVIELDGLLEPYWKDRPEEYRGGASVSLAVYDKEIKKLYTATVGDSPLVVMRGNQILHTSRSHDINRPGEADRVKAKGGVIYRGKVLVGGDVIAMTRSLGDYDLKPPLTPNPDVEEFNVVKGMNLVIGSDGMFEKLDKKGIEKRSVGIVEDLLSLGIKKIIDKYSNTTSDDCSLVVVKFV